MYETEGPKKLSKEIIGAGPTFAAKIGNVDVGQGNIVALSKSRKIIFEFQGPL